MKDLIRFFEKYRIVLIINLIFILGFGVILFYWSKGGSEQNAATYRNTSIVRVEIAGAVNKPGVYSLEEGKILEDLIKISGGLTERADKNKIAAEINRAEILADGEKIIIPQAGDPSTQPAGQVAGVSTSTGSSSNSSGQNIGKVNINTANLSQLDSLPGIGMTYGQRIIDYRIQNGGFKSVEEIKNIKGIGDKTFEKLQDLIML